MSNIGDKAQRPIKFRAWNNILKVMRHDSYQVFEVMADPQLRKDIDEGRYIPLRYTGLKDKNGKEIYEGDIIQFYDKGNIFDQDLLPCTSKVVMKYARWFPDPIDVKGLRGFAFNGYDENEDCEVIGNIYENPELVKNGRNE